MNLFCFGLGYTASTLVGKLTPKSWQYSGTHRTGTQLIFDGKSPLSDAADQLKNVTHLLISIPPNPNMIDPVLHHHTADILKMPNLKWIGYLSATSVYGDHNGKWVDEKSECLPIELRGQLRLKAEQLWLSLDLPVHIFRLGGIYGPGRNQIDAVKNGTAKKIIKKNHYISRIHVDDICSAVMLSMDNPSEGKIYNIVDDMPSSSAEVLDFLCTILNMPLIKGTSFDDDSLSDMAKSFYRDNKRVRNSLAKSDLEWKPRFPSYREGYQDILDKL